MNRLTSNNATKLHGSAGRWRLWNVENDSPTVSTSDISKGLTTWLLLLTITLLAACKTSRHVETTDSKLTIEHLAAVDIQDSLSLNLQALNMIAQIIQSQEDRPAKTKQNQETVPILIQHKVIKASGEEKQTEERVNRINHTQNIEVPSVLSDVAHYIFIITLGLFLSFCIVKLLQKI